MAAPPARQLVVGTYERFLLGYQLPDTLQGGCELRRVFTHAAHLGPVRCLDAAGPFVVSGGQDDQLHLYDAARGKDLGFVVNPAEGAVPCLQLYAPPGRAAPSHLFSGSDDGAIAVWAAGGGWEALKLMRGHRGPVNGLAVHPSGRLALSVGRDACLRMWHLGKGRCSYTARLDAAADAVSWCPGGGGSAYALLAGRVVTLHDATAGGAGAGAGAGAGEGGGGAGVLARLEHERRATCLLHAPLGGAVLVGCDDGRLALWDVRAAGAPRPVAGVGKAHDARLRALVALRGAGEEEGACGLPLHFASASSDGVVKVWDARRFGGGSGAGGGPTQLASVATRARITCMVLSDPAAAGSASGRGADDDSDDDANGDDDAEAAAAQGAAIKPKKKTGRGHEQQQQQQQQHQQQHAAHTPAAAAAATAEKKKQKKEKRKPSAPEVAVAGARGGGGGPGDGALVPKVSKQLLKKKHKQQQQQQQQIKKQQHKKLQHA